ncbi:MarR family transcriptional regulator [Hydrogenophaga sp.]|uniref:MarR family winged helix-turn-helix transcriptional regulator n=1 Tax=Hydrogenophaga sp. TaxID=1904254 RepID=UPI002616F73D|nr:MarR family transcriptional regulator [Hydrogenophaga sp.]MCW5655413.1 MarR family transcriptional regulator [Hydrogenophaga sp.]
MPTLIQDRFQRDFGYRISLISRRLRRAMDRELRLYGLTEATWRPLTHIKQLGNGIRQKDLAITLGIEGASLVALLNSLEKQGLIERRVNHTDKRAYDIRMTTAGHALCEEIGNVSARAHQAMFQGFSEQDVQALKRMVEQIEASLDTLLDAPEAHAWSAEARRQERKSRPLRRDIESST